NHYLKAMNKLNNEKLTAKAPPEVIAKERGKAEDAQLKKDGIEKRILILKN
ncbi:MAG: hypothetical protein GX333_09575, partial [Syntrophomonadaceae bacterium]|nr:hypothetical protein [Syntrophomonadaceae bacterium]